jgi:hypothetical protein
MEPDVAYSTPSGRQPTWPKKDVKSQIICEYGLNVLWQNELQMEHADQANDNEVDCHDKVEQARHNQN